MTAQSSPTETPPPNPVLNWSVNFTKAFKQWEAENAKYGADYQNLQTMITQMVALLHDKNFHASNVQKAFQLAQMGVMPGAMELQGDSMGQLAASMNIASALQESMTKAENNANYNGKITNDEAAQFIKGLKELYAEVSSAKGQKWMGDSTAQNILTAIKQICGEFGNPDAPITNPNQLTVANVQGSIFHWSTHLTTDFYGKTGQQRLQDLQAAMTQTTNGISSQSQGLQAEEQFAANTYTQYMNVCKGIFQATQRQDQSFVQNQKG